MREERFLLMLPNAIINDIVVRKSYYLSEKDDVEKLVNVLNEQQALINALKKENKELKEELGKGSDVPISYVENSLRRLRAEHKVDEQQATINKLKEENRKLKNIHWY